MTKKTIVRKPVKPVKSKTSAEATSPTPPVDAPRAFNKEVLVPEPTPEQAKARATALVVRDHNSRTAIELRRDAKDVIYIPNESDRPYRVERLSVLAFDQRFRPMLDYPVGRAARLCVGYAVNSGGTSDVMAELAKLVHVTEQEMQMAQAKTPRRRPPSGRRPSPRP
jgi:hypothetical protein